MNVKYEHNLANSFVAKFEQILAKKIAFENVSIIWQTSADGKIRVSIFWHATK